jgi:hypothetical protein
MLHMTRPSSAHPRRNMSLLRRAARALAIAALGLGLCACAASSGPGSPAPLKFDPNKPGNGMGGWYDGVGPRGNSAGGP